MPHRTRKIVESLLPAGTTIDDLSENEIAELFDSIIEQAQDDESPASCGDGGLAAAG